ncbi:MAG: hypothetical protein QXG65_03875 [Thermoplasmata archaeon]
MRVERLARDPRPLLVGCVRGLHAETYPLIDLLERSAPGALGLALSAEELDGIATYFAEADGETVIHLVDSETREIEALAEWGEVRVPNPSMVRAIEWARARDVPVHPLDPSDEGSAQMFTAHIGYVELVRRTLRERRLGRHPPRAETPDEFAVAWERTLHAGTGSRSLAVERDRHLVAEARRRLRSADRPAIVVDRERFDRIRAFLEETTGPE